MVEIPAAFATEAVWPPFETKPIIPIKKLTAKTEKIGLESIALLDLLTNFIGEFGAEPACFAVVLNLEIPQGFG
jgi:hypothetical protein